jgi:hypothetical protein
MVMAERNVMRVRVLTGAFVALLWSTIAASAQDVQNKSPGKAENPATVATGKVRGAFERHNCPRALALAKPLLASANPLPSDDRAVLYHIVTGCEIEAGNVDAAYSDAMAGTALPEASHWLWSIRLGLQLDRKLWPESVVTVEEMARGHQDVLNAIPIAWFGTLNRALTASHSRDLQRRLLAILAGGYYQPDDVTASVDLFREDFARLLIEDGDRKGAAALLGDITLPYVLLDLSLDKRFWGMVPANLDLRAAVERRIAATRALMAGHPDLLVPILDTAEALRQLGRPQEALTLLESARARVAGKGERFSDIDRKANWWWDSVARSEAMLGNVDRSFAAFHGGAAVEEDGQLNVSQLINLAHAQNRAGRPRDAIATLAPFAGKMSLSPYGMAEMREARGCANTLAGNPEAATGDLAYLRDHTEDNPDALTNLYLCMGDLDGAAAGMIARLDDPDRRVRALIDLSDYDSPPVALPPDPMRSKFPALKARSDVQAAIGRAGGIARVHLQPNEL